jgi:hypothetical protein
MALFTRRETPPAELTALLSREDRVLSWADAADGGVVLASTRGLWWPEPDAPRLIGWHLIDKAVWRDGVLTVIEAEVVDDLLLLERPALSLQLSKPRDLPPTVRKRIESNVVRSELRSVPGGAGRFVARRVPGRDGVVWRVRLEPGTLDSAQLRAHVSDLVEELRAQWSSPDI